MTNRATRSLRVFGLGLLLTIATATASAGIGLVVGEPFGAFGTMMPAGHAGIYLDHLCADTPTRLRTCRPGELGVVLSRYHDLRTENLDWMAVPVIPFLYGVDDPANTPAFVTASLEAELRESYREAHLRSVAPDRVQRGYLLAPKYGDWEEGIGAAFDRRLLIYTIDTTPEQDAAILAYLNDHQNRRRYSLHRNNCADFAVELLNIALPGVLHRNELADFDIMSPKTLASEMDAYGRTHPELNLNIYEVPQLPGTLRRSRPLRGAAETFLKTKRYLATLLILQPEAVLADWIVYEKKGKWTPGLDAQTLTPSAWATNMGNPSISRVLSSSKERDGWSSNNVSSTIATAAYSPASTSSSTTASGIGFLAK